MSKPIGRMLNDTLRIGAQHALYREDGRFYEHFRRFPGVLFDRNGYVLFELKVSYERCPALRHGANLNVPEGIAGIRVYVRDDRIAELVG